MKSTIQQTLILPVTIFKDGFTALKDNNIDMLDSLIRVRINWPFRDGRSSNWLNMTMSCFRSAKHDNIYLAVGSVYGEQRIEVVYTKPHYGGYRWWLQCPDCQTKRMNLHLETARFSCRTCLNLTYESTRLTETDTIIRRINRIKRKLGVEESLAVPIVWKPKGMHWRTFERLEGECGEHEGQLHAGIWARYAKLNK